MSNSNFALLLGQLRSSDSKNAEEQIEVLKKQNLGLFAYEMACQITNNNIPSDQRQLAALIVKNLVVGRSQKITEQLIQQWIQIPQDQRAAIKNIILQGLAFPDHATRAQVSQAVGQIGAVELQNNQWHELLEVFFNNIKSGSPILVEATLTSLGILCEETNNNVLATYSDQILNAIVSGLQNNSLIEVCRAAIKAILGALHFVRKNFENNTQRDYLMGVIMSAAESTDKEISYFALQCLVRVAELYYDYLPQYLSHLWPISQKLMNSGSGKIAQQAIEFWTSIGEQEVPSDEFESKPLQIIEKAADQLCIVLFECLTKQSDDIYDDEWNVSKSAATCLAVVARCTPATITKISFPFVQAGFNSDNWRMKEAALMVVGSISGGPAENDEQFLSFLSKVVPFITQLIVTESNEVIKDTGIWCIAKIARHSAAIEPHIVSIINALLVTLKSTEPIIASQTCYALANVISIYQYDGEETSPLTPAFKVLFTGLLEAGDRLDGLDNNLCITAYEAMIDLIKNAADDCLETIGTLIDFFVGKLEKTFTAPMAAELQTSQQTYIPCVLQEITHKITDAVAPHALKILSVLFQVFDFKKEVTSEPLIAVNTIFSECPATINETFEKFKSYLLGSLRVDDDCCLIAGLNCVGTICDALGDYLFTHDNGKFCSILVTLLFTCLKEAQYEVKPEILSTFGELALALKGHFEPYVPALCVVLRQASTVSINEDDDDNTLDYVIGLRASILDTYTLMLRAIEKKSLLITEIGHMFQFMIFVWGDVEHRTKQIAKGIISLIGDIAKDLPQNDEKRRYIHSADVTAVVNYARNRSTNAKIREIANWTAKQIQNVK